MIRFLPFSARGRHRRAVPVAARIGVGLAAVALWPAGLVQSDPPSGDNKTPPTGHIRFEDRQPASGIDFVLDNSTTPDKPIIDSMLGGVAVLDFDNDGLLDVFFTNGARIPELQKDDPRFWNRLYRNQGDGTFRDVTDKAGVHGEGFSIGVAAADFDNDGWTDLYVTGVNRNTLYRNRGDGRFADVTETAGVSGTVDGKKVWSVGAAWLDYDNDGDLDLFVANYLDWSPENNRLCGIEGMRLSCSPTYYEKLPNLLYRNEGGGKFLDVSAATGISDHMGYGMSVAVADADGDGFTDVFVANDQIGSPQTPVTLTAADMPVTGDGVLAIDVDEGWNWISTNILSPDMSVDGVTADLTPAPGDIVKSQSEFTQFVSDSTGWVPTMVIDNVSSYMIRLSNAGTIYHSGTLVPVDSMIPVGQGWNWVGYLPDGTLGVTVALGDLDTQGIVSTNDVIKSQDNFAQFYGSEWYGSLDSMKAGEGYKLYLGAAGNHTFNYPAYVPGPSPPPLIAAATLARSPVEGAPAWAVNPRAYQYNMTVTSVLRIGDSESADHNDIIGAFVGDECRGVASPVYVESMRRYIAFLMIHSNEAEGEEVTFRAFDAGAALVYEIDESIACSADAVEGTVFDPLVLNAGQIREEESDLPPVFGLSQNYPNPFNPVTAIHYDVPAGGGMVSIRIYDVGGRLVRTLVNGHETAGRKSVVWRGLDNRGKSVTAGVYFYRLTAPGFEKTRKMVLLK